MMRLIDLHADTPLEIYRKNADLRENTLHVDVLKSAGFDAYVQCAALFCPTRVCDADGLSFDLAVADVFCDRISQCDNALQIFTRQDLERAIPRRKRGFVLTLEDARVLSGSLDGVPQLFGKGVRLVTPFWRGTTTLGGAHNTSDGLTQFGVAAIEAFLQLGAGIDVSHASKASFWDILALSQQFHRPPVATHSCAAAVHPHTRNLEDAQIRAIAEQGGVIGVNLYPPFLGAATLEALFVHIRHVFNVGGLEVVSSGSDFDGVDSLPHGICDLSSFAKLPEAMHAAGFSHDEIEHFTFRNANRYLCDILPTQEQ